MPLLDMTLMLMAPNHIMTYNDQDNKDNDNYDCPDQEELHFLSGNNLV